MRKRRRMAEQLEKNKRKQKNEMNERTVHRPASSGYRVRYCIAYNTCKKYIYMCYRGYFLFMGRALEFTLSLSRLRRAFPDTVNNKKALQPRPHRRILYIYSSRLLVPQRARYYFSRIEIWKISGFCTTYCIGKIRWRASGWSL